MSNRFQVFKMYFAIFLVFVVLAETVTTNHMVTIDDPLKNSVPTNNGVVVTGNEAPFMAQLYIQLTPEQGFKFYCGGSFIGNRTVLITSTCVYK